MAENVLCESRTGSDFQRYDNYDVIFGKSGYAQALAELAQSPR